jgi:hypothetical protein
MAPRTQLNSSDLYVVLEKAFRRRARECGGCTFSMPYSQHYHGESGKDWTITLTNNCSPRCVAILEELVNRYRREYELAAA